MKNSQLQIRVSDAEKKALQKAANLEGKSLSAWVLSKLLPDPNMKFLLQVEQISDLGKDYKYAISSLGDFLMNLSSENLERIFQGSFSLRDYLNPRLANYVAAMLELCAHRRKLQSPGWLKDVEPLESPYFATELQSIRLHLLKSSPAPFRARNIFIDTSFEGRV